MGPATEIHVWHAVRTASAAGLLERLSTEERDRAARFRVPRVREDFIFHHAVLRAILRGVLGREPVMTLTPLGKPVLSAGALHFNMAHCGPAGLYAVAEREIGVDLERIRAMRSASAIARRFFTAREHAAIGDSDEAFLTCWTRKEAVLKASGKGLTGGLKTFEAFPADLPLTLELERRYTLAPLPQIAGYAAAAAIAGETAAVLLHGAEQIVL
ncbi:MAG: 4'-phosphopantetheinyl transferase superfamily protein [Bryobacteraceae bacterium]